MLARYYLCTAGNKNIAGLGNVVWPAGFGTITKPYTVVDGRNTAGAGRLLVIAIGLTLAEHTAISGTVGVTWIPLVNLSTGAVLDSNDTIATVGAARLLAIRNSLEALNVPLDDADSTWTVAAVIRRIRRRFLLRQILDVVDIAEDLDSDVSLINAIKWGRIKATLAMYGYEDRESWNGIKVRGLLKFLMYRPELRILQAE